jgi:hypothetical protein
VAAGVGQFLQIDRLFLDVEGAGLFGLRSVILLLFAL